MTQMSAPDSRAWNVAVPAEMGLLSQPSFIEHYSGTFSGREALRSGSEMILRFPFPFDADAYIPSVNVEPHDRTGETAALHAIFDVDAHYPASVANRAAILHRDPARYQSKPYMMDAQWEAMIYMMENLARDFPDHFAFRHLDGKCRWINRLLHIDKIFEIGNANSLPFEPFEYITRQVQGDFMILDQREDTLWLDVGIVTEGGGWSFDFIFGMDWRGIHGPVRGERERRIVERALRMTLSLGSDAPQRRVNWFLTVTPRMDIAMESRHLWDPGLPKVSKENVADDVYFRVELQQLHRLPASNAIIFVLRNYMLSIRDLARIPKWGKRLHRVLRDLDPTLDRAKSMKARQEVVDWLAPFDDGAPTTPGRGPDHGETAR